MFKFTSTINVENFKQLASEIEQKRVCLRFGKQLYPFYISSTLLGKIALERSNVPDLREESESLTKEVAKFLQSLQEDLEKFDSWLKLLKIDEDFKSNVLSFVAKFPLFKISPEIELDSDKFMSELKYSVTQVVDSIEQSIYKDIYDFVNMLYAICSDFLFITSNYRLTKDLVYADENQMKPIPKKGYCVDLLYSVIPATERAKAILNFVSGTPIFSLSNWWANDNEGQLLTYYDSCGNKILSCNL